MCDGDSICDLPYRLLSAFVPSGYWGGADATTTLTVDSCDETPKYPGQGMRIVYTGSGGWGWGASFLNNDNWTGEFKVSPKAKKITFKVKTDYSANVTFNAFGDGALYGKVELIKLGVPVTPVWEKFTITLLDMPDDFEAPLSIVIDNLTNPNGQVVVVDIKDVLVE